MLEKFNINDKDIFPVCVMATMSSGKSTFINALLGEEILPEKNEACTAHAMAVLSSPTTAAKKVYIIKKNGERGYATLDNHNIMKRVDADEEVEAILIESDISGIFSPSRPLVLIDTPGVNNSQDIRHAERTKEILEHLEHGVIVYLMNATQLAANDDALLLQMVSDHLKKHPELKICFVLNKIDMLDEDKEAITDIVSNARKYIEDYDFHDSMIFPLSAISAKILRLQLNNKYMTANERRRLTNIYEEYKAVENNMLRYSGIYGLRNRQYTIGENVLSEYELRRAIENTGIVGIERQITDFILQEERQTSICIIETRHYSVWEKNYAYGMKARNFINFSGKAKWLCKQCRQINGDNSCCLNCGRHNIIWRLGIATE